MQGKIKIIESDNKDLIKEGKVLEDTNIHFSGINTHILTDNNKNKKEEYIFQIDFVTVEAESFLFDGELRVAGTEKPVSNVELRFTPFFKKD